MEIQQIKQNLSLSQILNHYGLKPKNNMLNCPFHEDKTASLQVNLEKHFYKCHACGAKGDQIQWVQDYESARGGQALTKHEAILKCVSMINPNTINVPVIENDPSLKGEQAKQKTTPVVQTDFLEKMFSSFRKGIFNSQPAKDYCKQRNLNLEKLSIGFNSGQFHHGERRDETLINNCLSVGLLLDRGLTSKTGEKAFNVFGNKSLVFPLKNKESQIVSFYFRSTVIARNEANSKHFYLKNRQGLYPNYPKPETKKLILTESIIDCASLLQIDEVNKNYSLIACFGTNGLNEEILKSIQDLSELEEIIFFFDGDKAGNEAVTKQSEIIRELHPNIKISQVETTENEDINSLIIGHENEILIHLLDQRKELKLLFSIEEKPKATG